MVGTEVGSFRILEELSQGQLGALYRALDLHLDRAVALRALNLDLAGNPEVEQRFRAEIKPLGELYHSNLVVLHALLVEQGRPWIVTEFVEGETFEQMVRRRGPIPSEEAVALFRQALFGIGYAHRKGVFHRDITPGNLIVNREGVVKVMDFGLAKALSARGVAKAGTRFGKPAYMSPEQFLNRPADARSDVYSLGVVLYEMLTGKVPFAADDDYQIMADHVNTAPLPPSRIVASVPRAAELAVLKALEKNPNARHQTVQEFSAGLSGSEAGSSPTPAIAVAVPAQPAVAASPSISRFLATREQKLVAAAVVAILVLGGVLAAMRIRANRAATVAQAQNLASNPTPQQDAANQVQPVPSPDAVAVAPGVAAAPADGEAPADAGGGDASQAAVIPAGTVVAVRINDAVSSTANLPGQTFDASVDNDVTVAGSVLVPAGSDATLRLIKVAQVPDAERSDVQLQLVNLNINGADYRARSSVFEQQSLPKTKKSVATAGARAAFGAVGGFLSHGGAGQGAAAGAASTFVIYIAPQTRIPFTLKKRITLSQ